MSAPSNIESITLGESGKATIAVDKAVVLWLSLLKVHFAHKIIVIIQPDFFYFFYPCSFFLPFIKNRYCLEFYISMVY